MNTGLLIKMNGLKTAPVISSGQPQAKGGTTGSAMFAELLNQLSAKSNNVLQKTLTNKEASGSGSLEALLQKLGQLISRMKGLAGELQTGNDQAIIKEAVERLVQMKDKLQELSASLDKGLSDQALLSLISATMVKTEQLIQPVISKGSAQGSEKLAVSVKEILTQVKDMQKRSIEQPDFTENSPKKTRLQQDLPGAPRPFQMNLTAAKQNALSGHAKSVLPESPDKKSSGTGEVQNNKQVSGFQPGIFSKPEQYIIHTKPDQAFNQQLSERIADMVKSMSVKQMAAGSKQITVDLHPRNLGQLTIVVTKSDDGGISAHFTVHNEAAKDLLQSQVGQLKQQLMTQHMPVHKIEIQQNNIPAFTPDEPLNHQDQSQENSQGGQQREQQDNREPEDNTFQQWLERDGASEY